MCCLPTVGSNKSYKLDKNDLWDCFLTNECVPALCELLRNECRNLIDLKLGGNPGIKDEGLRILCEYAIKNAQCKLEIWNLSHCSLTDDCVPDLCNALKDEHCKLTSLKLAENNITDEGLHMLCELVLTNRHCRLEKLDLKNCSLTLTVCLSYAMHCKMNIAN